MTNESRPRVELNAAMLTDVGVVRDHNEDSAYVDPEMQFFIVADGMGGHAAGEVASAMAVERVQQALENKRSLIDDYVTEPTEDGRKKLVTLLDSAVRNAHKAVFERGTRENDKHGMGTTLDVVVVAGPEAFVAHVGDSRTYLIRDSRAAQITTDHTVAEVLVIEGKLSLEEAQISPLRTILVNAIGVAPDVGIEMAHVQLRKGDHLLLCSDGLHDYFPVEQELADCLTKREPETAIDELVTQAKDRGGHDNITGIVVRVERCDSVALAGEFKTPEQLLAEDITATLPLDSVADEVASIVPEISELDGAATDMEERSLSSLARAETEEDSTQRMTGRESIDPHDDTLDSDVHSLASPSPAESELDGENGENDEAADFAATVAEDPTLEHSRANVGQSSPDDDD